MNKVEKIKAEIERRYEYWKEKESNSHSIESESRMSECQHLLLLFDSLQEEPISNDLEEAAKNYEEDAIFYAARRISDYFKAGAQWQKEQIVLNDNNKEYHRVPSTTLKRLYMNEAKYELLKSDIMEGIVGDFEKGVTHNYLTIKIPMLLCPSNCAKGDKVKLIIINEE